MNLTKSHWLVIAFNILYLTIGGLYFLQDLNHEFVIYVVVIVMLLSGVFATLKHTRFPVWMLWLFSIWGLMHVLGGAIETRDGVLFAYKIYPFFDGGGEMYILKYDQFVHAYLYGLVGIMTFHILRNILGIRSHTVIVVLLAILTAVGISALNEIMEFIIAMSLERNGVGGYINAMLDFIFNLGGAVLAVLTYTLFSKKSQN